VKFYNKSSLPTKVLERVIAAAGRRSGARIENVVVKVTQRRRRYDVSGEAQRCAFVYAWHLMPKRKFMAQDYVATDGGYFTLTVPRPGKGVYDALHIAETIYKVALHEWVHIADYQALNRGEQLAFSKKLGSGRRPLHDRRPEELRAINKVDEVTARPLPKSDQDAIIALALAYEEAAHGSKTSGV
jgi:hypothetical protein